MFENAVLATSVVLSMLGAGGCGGSSGPGAAVPETAASTSDAGMGLPAASDDDALRGFRDNLKRKEIVTQLMLGEAVWTDNATSEVFLDSNAHWTFTNNLKGKSRSPVSVAASAIDGVPKRNLSSRISGADTLERNRSTS